MKKIILVLALFSLGACVSAPKKLATVQPDKISIMTMNAENLFDTDDDPEKNDEAFLPAAKKADPYIANRCRTQNDSEYRAEECLSKDWNDTVLKRKFRRLTDVVEQVQNGNGPDILILQEIENRHVLEMWRDGYLKHMNYQTISHIESPDERGIDTAVMTRLPLVDDPILHTLDYAHKAPELNTQSLRPTRGILESHLRLPSGETLYVFAVHFPSQGAPTIHRKVAVETLLDLLDQVPAGMPVIVGGDFNITSKEEWKEKYFRTTISPKMSVSHVIGCGTCSGSTYYWPDKTWSFFDVLLFSKNMDGGLSSWQVSRDSIHIVDSSRFQYNRFGSPAHYDDGKGSTGVTDHLPMYAEIIRREELKTGEKR